MAEKTHPCGTALLWDADGVDPYTQVADVVSITPPSMEWGNSDITPLEGSGASGGPPAIGACIRQFLAGWQDSGQIEFTVFFHKTQLAALFAALIGTSGKPTTVYWRIMFPLITGETANSRIDFQGFLSNFDWDEISKDEDDAITYAMTIKITGAVVFTAGT